MPDDLINSFMTGPDENGRFGDFGWIPALGDDVLQGLGRLYAGCLRWRIGLCEQCVIEPGGKVRPEGER